jgi:hypothetical protein
VVSLGHLAFFLKIGNIRPTRKESPVPITKLPTQVRAEIKMPTVVFPPPALPNTGARREDTSSATTQLIRNDTPQPNAWPEQHPANRGRSKSLFTLLGEFSFDVSMVSLKYKDAYSLLMEKMEFNFCRSQTL